MSITLPEISALLQTLLNERAVNYVLLLFLCLAWGARCYWRGKDYEANRPAEDGGWQEEAHWWRANFVQLTKDCRELPRANQNESDDDPVSYSGQR